MFRWRTSCSWGPGVLMNVSVGNIVLLRSRCTYEYLGGEHRALEVQVYLWMFRWVTSCSWGPGVLMDVSVGNIVLLTTKFFDVRKYFLKRVCNTSVATDCCTDCPLLYHWTWCAKLLKSYCNFVWIHYTGCCNTMKSVKLVSLFLYPPFSPSDLRT